MNFGKSLLFMKILSFFGNYLERKTFEFRTTTRNLKFYLLCFSQNFLRSVTINVISVIMKFFIACCRGRLLFSSRFMIRLKSPMKTPQYRSTKSNGPQTELDRKVLRFLWQLRKLFSSEKSWINIEVLNLSSKRCYNLLRNLN